MVTSEKHKLQYVENIKPNEMPSWNNYKIKRNPNGNERERERPVEGHQQR